MNPWYRAENWLAGVKNVAAFATFGAYARVAACSGKRNDEMPRFGMMPVAQRIGIEVRSWNRLLDAVHDDDLAAMLDGAQRVSHPRGEILSQQGKTIEKVYFPVTAVLSLVTTLADGSTIEMSTIGNEGTTGTTIYLGADSISNATCLCQIPGDSLCVDARTFRAAAGESEHERQR